jgi:hypothetical protein
MPLFFVSRWKYAPSVGSFHLCSSVFDSVVVVAFQIAFRAEIHVNDVFSFFKNYF